MPAGSREAIGFLHYTRHWFRTLACFSFAELGVPKKPLAGSNSCRLCKARVHWRLPPKGPTNGQQLYVSNLPPSATEQRLATRFRKFGVVHFVALEAVVRPKRRGALVEMETSADALNAIAALNLSDFDGSLVSVSRALARA